MLGILFAVLAALCWGVSAIFVRLGVQSMRPATGTWLSLITGTVLVMTLAVAFNWREITALASIAFLWFALSGFFNFALGRLLNTTSIQLVGVARASPLFSIAPLFATALAIVFLGESITPWLLVGTLTVALGIGLITSEQAQR